MVRTIVIAISCAVLLAGCDRAPEVARQMNLTRDETAPVGSPSPAAGLATEATVPAQQQFSYTHSWAVVMAHGTVAPRFARARDLCLHDPSLDCRLVSANMTSSGDNLDSVSATLEVQLPRGKLDGFEHALLAPVKGEAAGDAVMQSRSTQAQSVETAAGDTARKVAQLTAYRDRLADIAKRPNLSVDDIIKIEAERARVQGDLDEATGQQRTLTSGIAREDVSITLSERTVPVGRFASFFSEAGETLTDSAANALLFAIGAVPWLPLLVLLVWLVSLLWRWFLRRRTARSTAAPSG
ncbi:MAG: DUF4349 domain-containing protein [Alphaproteobacteria bacterium]|nr:DUF4349 domain-containing protein [Alphaproteobacteria bacterium]MBL6938625.1 DUF4349 domain-containing protein [Alphaproteobacteria bacterium]MBL7098018.1 DUF4349 domain-containing protein [Alphaproteobacteria bacterium]